MFLRSKGLDLPFVFVIGFNRTGTTSLHKFFQANGFPSVHHDDGRLARTMLENCCDGKKILAGYDHKFRVFSDLTFRNRRIRFEANSLFRTMDADYPGSFFIYNTRDLQDWLNSRAALRTVSEGETALQFELRQHKTDDPQRVFEKWARQREAFEWEVRDYFAGNPRFLEVDILDPLLPDKIASLLGMPLDKAHWQRHNQTEMARRAKAD